jgi:hypothetical protein
MRRHDWQSRFAAYIKEKQRADFQWGVNDCCLFVCDGIFEIAGKDPAESFRGRYDSMVTGYKLIREFCGGGIEELSDAMARIHGFIEVDPKRAQRGDLGLHRNIFIGDTLGICIGDTWAFMRESEGCVYLKTNMISRAWRI